MPSAADSRQRSGLPRHLARGLMAILTLWGLGFAFFPDAVRMVPFEAVFYGDQRPAFFADPEAARTVDFYTALMGAVTAGWFATLFLVLKVRQRAVWEAAIAGLAVWFVIDSAASIVFGFPANALINVGLLGIAVPILLFSRPSQ
ncbi:MAG: hypothetical protein V2I43_09495 [Parvularcula sp.]|jgi:hypothetical protein|nr:hypothetical protein [Parvularcula sp.]